MRRTITKTDAERYIGLVKKRFASWIEAGYSAPKAVEDWDGRGHWGIVWEEGPYEWAYYGTAGSFEYAERMPMEFGSVRLPIIDVPGSLAHVFSEPYNGFVVMLYLDN